MDKLVIYQFYDGVFKCWEFICFFLNNIKRILQDIDSMSQIFIVCVGRMIGIKGLEGNVRFEVWVKFLNFVNVLVGLDRYLLDGLVVGIKIFVWWQVFLF